MLTPDVFRFPLLFPGDDGTISLNRLPGGTACAAPPKKREGGGKVNGTEKARQTVPSLNRRVFRPLAAGMLVICGVLTLLGFLAAYPAAREASRVGWLAAGALLVFALGGGAAAALCRLICRRYLLPVSQAADAVTRAATGDLSTATGSIPRASSEVEALLGAVEGLGSRGTDCLLDMERVLRAIAGGDLTARLACGQVAECGGTCKALEDVSQELRGAIGSVRSSMEQTTGEFLVLEREADALAQNEEQRRQAQDAMTRALDRLTGQLHQHSEAARQLSGAAESLQARIDACSQQLEELSQAVERISDCAAETRNIVKSMESTAFQCSVLARTAYVEAAGAEVNGKGFAIVASEMRVLASRSAQAAQDADALMGEIHQTIREGVTLTAAARRELQAVVLEGQEVRRKSAGAANDAGQDIELAETVRQSRRLNALGEENKTLTQRSVRTVHLLQKRLDMLREALRVFRIN